MIGLAQQKKLSNEGWDSLVHAVLGLRQYFINFGRARDGVTYVTGLLDRIPEADGQERNFAKLLNNVGMLAWSHDDLDTCIEFTRRAYEKNDKEAAYVYNLLLAYKKTRGPEDAVFKQWLDRLASFEQLSLSNQRYLADHGREYSGATVEEEDEAEGMS